MTTRSILIFCLSLWGSASAATASERARMDLGLGEPSILAGETSTTFLRISLTGLALPSEHERSPVNIALVLDRSGSMQGEKIRQAREAAVMAIDLLDSRDIISVIAYDDSVETIVPATRLDERAYIKRAIRNIDADGSTALFAGVSKGAKQLRKFLSDQRVNRVILLSDGQANVGPRSPWELGELGASLAEEGMSVTTIGLGLGYNEDLMTRLAQRSDGNHAFVENSRDLARIFEYEFNDVLSVVAQDVTIQIHCPPGVKPKRLIGRDADIRGQVITTELRQLYADQEKYVILELELPVGKSGDTLEVAKVDASYRDIFSGKTVQLQGLSKIAYTDNKRIVKKKQDKAVITDALEQIGVEESEAALELRDQGKTKEAKRRLEETSRNLAEQAKKYDAKKLEGLSKQYDKAVDDLDATGADWSRSRKAMRKDQYQRKNQTSY